MIHGPDGVSRKSSEPGHASHYISFTRLAVSGKVRVGEETHSVSGSAWMDHEFFSDGLAADHVGWDWMSIQLENNTELMLYRLRRRDGTADPFSSGTYVDAGGRAQHLGAEDFVMEPGGVWRSPETTGRYPVQWKVSVPSLRIVLECRTDLTSQEIVSRRQVGPNYWEGAVSFEGLVGDEEIRRGRVPRNDGLRQACRARPGRNRVAFSASGLQAGSNERPPHPFRRGLGSPRSAK